MNVYPRAWISCNCRMSILLEVNHFIIVPLIITWSICYWYLPWLNNCAAGRWQQKSHWLILASLFFGLYISGAAPHDTKQLSTNRFVDLYQTAYLALCLQPPRKRSILTSSWNCHSSWGGFSASLWLLDIQSKTAANDSSIIVYWDTHKRQNNDKHKISQPCKNTVCRILSIPQCNLLTLWCQPHASSFSVSSSFFIWSSQLFCVVKWKPGFFLIIINILYKGD